MKILLNAFDSASNTGPFPNLAIMRISAWHKQQGDNVALEGAGLSRQDIMPDPDIVYVSCIFDWNGAQAKGLRWMFPEKTKFILGGSGIDLDNKLPLMIEAMGPDETLYDNRGVPGWPFALGFSSRGCNRKCGFCIVPQKEGKINPVWDLDKIVNDHDKLLLLDNNFTQDPDVENKMKWLSEWGGRVNFSQGLDARVIERKPHLAGLLADINYRSRTFETKLLTMAYDHPNYRKIIERAVNIMKDAGHNVRASLQFFVLTNYNTTFEQDIERVEHLRSMGTMPYLMIYDKKNAPKNVRRLQRYCNNKMLFWNTTWKDYDLNPEIEMGEVQVGDF